jgi:hypothetical protein
MPLTPLPCHARQHLGIAHWPRSLRDPLHDNESSATQLNPPLLALLAAGGRLFPSLARLRFASDGEGGRKPPKQTHSFPTTKGGAQSSFPPRLGIDGFRLLL